MVYTINYCDYNAVYKVRNKFFTDELHLSNFILSHSFGKKSNKIEFFNGIFLCTLPIRNLCELWLIDLELLFYLCLASSVVS